MLTHLLFLLLLILLFIAIIAIIAVIAMCGGRGATESLKMVGEYFPWAFNNNSNNLLRTSACVDTDSNTSSITRTISSASSMSTSSYGSSAHAAGTGSGSSSHFIYTQANHKSVLGIGAYAKQHGAHLHCLSLEDMQQWLDSPCSTTPQQHHHHAAFKASSCVNGLCCAGGSPTHHAAVQPGAGSCCGAPVPPHTPTAAEAAAAAGVSGAAASSCCGSGVTHHLVAYPAKDNYEGRIYPLQWIEQVGWLVVFLVPPCGMYVCLMSTHLHTCIQPLGVCFESDASQQASISARINHMLF